MEVSQLQTSHGDRLEINSASEQDLEADSLVLAVPVGPAPVAGAPAPATALPCVLAGGCEKLGTPSWVLQNHAPEFEPDCVWQLPNPDLGRNFVHEERQSSPTISRTTGVVSRGTEKSLAALPQHLRGISLQELWTFCEPRRAWLEQLRWRCADCHQSCACEECGQPLTPSSQLPKTHGACRNCGGTKGDFEMRNPYEVNSDMIKPTCMSQRISYVEYLDRRRQKAGGMPIKTFVSHYWGGEFPKLISALTRYANVKISGRQHCRLWRRVCYLHSCCLCCHCCCQCRDAHRERVANWSFWICAFANNQFAIDHALVAGDDVMSSAFATALRAETCTEVVAIVDKNLEIYRRIWCAFELFIVEDVLPATRKKRQEVMLVNEKGIVSYGDADQSTLRRLADLVLNVRVADAQASVEADKLAIQATMAKHGVSYEHLDAVLCQLATDGVRTARLRKWTPLIVFVLIPMSGDLFALGQDSLAQCEYGNAIVFICMFVFMTLALPCLALNSRCGGGWRRQRPWNTLRRFLEFWLEVNFLTCISLIILAVSLLRVSGIVAQAFKVLRMTRLLVDAQSSFFIFGALFALLYVPLRDRQKFASCRRCVEDVLCA